VITVLVVRDPDGGNDIQIWNGNVEITQDCHVVEVDPGRGYDYENWLEMCTADVDATQHSIPQRAVLEAYLDPPGTKYIDGWPDQ
jgi:hypothetical protein